MGQEKAERHDQGAWINSEDDANVSYLDCGDGLMPTLNYSLNICSLFQGKLHIYILVKKTSYL